MYILAMTPQNISGRCMISMGRGYSVDHEGTCEKTLPALGGIPSANRGTKDRRSLRYLQFRGPQYLLWHPFPNSSGCFESFFSVAYDINEDIPDLRRE